MSNSTVQIIVFLVSIALMFSLGVFLVVKFDLDPVPGMGIVWGIITVGVSVGVIMLAYREEKK